MSRRSTLLTLTTVAYGPPGAYDKHQFASINVYYCSALMLDRLRHRVGARDFARLLRAWPQAQRDGNADRGEWVRFAERVTGEQLSHFVHEWLTSPTTPRWGGTRLSTAAPAPGR